MRSFPFLYSLSLAAAMSAPPALGAAAPHPLDEVKAAVASYDFDKAAERLEAAAKRLKGDASMQAEIESARMQISHARRALDNVRKVRFIERYDVPAEDFYRHVRIPSSAGRLLPADSIPFEQGRQEATLAFSNEGGDYMMWCQTLDDGRYAAVESTRLTDGTWQEPHPLSEVLSPEGEMDFPVMRSDGVTLYFASSSAASMGGMDLFVASRDPQTGEYLEPRNMGMPFNSPFDDLMLAVDEDNGVGWLVTDRNQIPDKLSVYLYLLEEPRVNLDPEEENIVDRARISKEDFLSADDPLRAEKLKAVAQIPEGEKDVSKPDFLFPLPGGRVVRSLDEFASRNARKLFPTYQSALYSLQENERTLASLRVRYAEESGKGKGSTSAFASLQDRILQLESEIEKQREGLKKLRNDIISSELERK